MRKSLLFLSTLCLFLIMTGCSDDETSNDPGLIPYNIYFTLHVEDKDGSDLLDKANDHAILDNGLSLTFRGRTYNLATSGKMPVGAFDEWSGFLWTEDVSNEGKPVIYLAKLCSSQHIKEEAYHYEVNWNDGTPATQLDVTVKDEKVVKASVDGKDIEVKVNYCDFIVTK